MSFLQLKESVLKLFDGDLAADIHANGCCGTVGLRTDVDGHLTISKLGVFRNFYSELGDDIDIDDDAVPALRIQKFQVGEPPTLTPA